MDFRELRWRNSERLIAELEAQAEGLCRLVGQLDAEHASLDRRTTRARTLQMRRDEADRAYGRVMHELAITRRALAADRAAAARESA